MTLQLFKERFQRLINEHKLNIKLSGVAIMSDLAHVYYSASVEVDRPGIIPSPSDDAIEEVRKIFQQYQLCDFTFSRLWNITALRMPDEELCRWQVNYLFRN